MLNNVDRLISSVSPSSFLSVAVIPEMKPLYSAAAQPTIFEGVQHPELDLLGR